MTDSPAGARIVTLLDEASIAQLLLDVAQQVSLTQYLFLPHPGSPTAFAAAPQEAPAFVEVITDFKVEQTAQYSIVTPAISWRADASTELHPAAAMIVAEFRFAISQVDPSAYELASDALEQRHTSPTSPSWSPAQPAMQQPPPVALLPTRQLPEAAPVSVQAPAAPPTVVPSPTPAPVEAAAPAAPAPVPAQAAEPAPTPSWSLRCPDQRVIPLQPQNILGRNPRPYAQRPAAQLVRLVDPARSISNTHAVLETSGASAWLTDLGSTNGSRALTSRSTTECLPDTPVQVAPGDVIVLGEFELTLLFE